MNTVEDLLSFIEDSFYINVKVNMPHSLTTKCAALCYFCLIEVMAMVVAVHQPSAECTAIFIVCIV